MLTLTTLMASPCDIVGVGRSGRVPRRTAGEPPVARVSAKHAVAAHGGIHAEHGTKGGIARDDQPEGFPAHGVGQGRGEIINAFHLECRICQVFVWKVVFAVRDIRQHRTTYF